MSSMLRCIALTARASRSARRVATTPFLTSNIPRNFVHPARSLVSQSRSRPSNDSHVALLDRELFRLDGECRRSGRIVLRDLQEIVKQASSQESLSASQALLLIRATGGFLRELPPSSREPLTVQVWQMAKRQNLDISHYNALLQVYLENSTKFEPLEFLNELNSAGVQPNRVTYQRLIQRYCDIPDIGGATKILEFMKNEQLAVSEKVFNSLISGHLKSGDSDAAKKMIDVMNNAKLTPTSETYTVLACGLAENKAGMAEIMATMEGQLLSDDQVLRVFKAVALTGNENEAALREVLSRMPKAPGYTQDLINICLELITLLKVDPALLLVRELPHSSNMESGNFFIAQMVKSGLSIDEVYKVCQSFKAAGFNESAIRKAAEMALCYCDRATGIAYLELMRKEGHAIRPHFFNPILIKCSDESQILDSLKIMVKMNAEPDFEFVRDFVLDRIIYEDTDGVVKKMLDAGCSLKVIVTALAKRLFIDRNLVEAKQLLTKHNVSLNVNNILVSLAASIETPADAENGGSILKMIIDRADDNQKYMDIAGRFLGAVNDSAFKLCVTALASEGLQIGNNAAVSLQSKGRDASILAVTTRRYSGENDNQYLNKDMPLEELESHLIELEGKNMNTRGVLRKLLMQYSRLRMMDKVEETLKKLEGEIFSAGMLAKLIDIYVVNKDLEKAMLYYKQILEYPNFTLDDYKIIDLVALFTTEGKLPEGLQIFEAHKRRNGFQEKSDQMRGNASRLIKAAVEKYGVDEAIKLIKVTVVQMTPISSIVLAPVMKVFLDKGDIETAMKLFQEFSNEHKITPSKREISIALIKANDQTSLNTVTNISNAVHGEANTICDLVQYYLECGMIDQAKQLLHTVPPRGLQRFEKISSFLLDLGLADEMEAALEITKDLNYNRDTLYYNIMVYHGRSNDVDRALEVWTRAQENNDVLSQRTLRYLAKLLEQSGKEVPFEVTRDFEPRSVAPGIRESPFQRLLRENGIDACLSYRKDVIAKGESMNVTEESSLLALLVKDDRVTEATEIAKEVYARQLQPQRFVMKSLLSALARLGAVKELEDIQSYIPEDMRLSLGVDGHICSAYADAGRASEYLERLERIPATEKIDYKSFDILCKNAPELQSRVYSLALKFAKEGNYYGPMNVLWAHHFSKGDYGKADEIMKEFPQLKENLLFNNILTAATLLQDEAMSGRLVTVVENEVPSYKRHIYSCHIDILLANGKVDDAIACVQAAQEKGVELKDLNRKTLDSLKKECALSGKEMPFKIPERSRFEARA